jgi:hypothetical protein
MNSLPRTVASLNDAACALARQAVAEYTPIVESILSERSQDVARIERTLDGLLDICFDPEALLLYKKLCRHYFDIDPAATAWYVQSYRETWDSDPGDGIQGADEVG